MLTSQLPAYAVTNLGGEPTLYIFALALFSVGTGIGSLLCEKLSARTVEIGLVPLGAFGMTAFLLDLYFARSGEATVQGLAIGPFLQQPGSSRIVIDLVGIGLFTGIFVVPLFALIQSRTPKAQMSRVFAALNIQNSGFIVAAALLSLAAHTLLHWTIPQQFLALAIANALVAIYIFTIVPEFLMRFLSWLMVRTLYRLRPHGIEANVPDEGAALLVCNHVSYMDALILSATIPRPVRFVMYYRIFNIPVMRWIFRTAKAIPIAGAREDPALMQRAFDEIDAALAEGELVCIFPEGALTRMVRWPRSSRALRRSSNGGRCRWCRWPCAACGRACGAGATAACRMRVPRRFRATVEVVAAPAVDGHSTSAPVLEAQVRALRGDHA